MKTYIDLKQGFYEASETGITFKGEDYVPLLIDSIKILCPDEFVADYKKLILNESQHIRLGALFDTYDLYLLADFHIN